MAFSHAAGRRVLLLLLLLLLVLLLVLATARPPARSRVWSPPPAPGRPPASLSVHDDFFNARELVPLRALCAWLYDLPSNLFATAPELRSLAAGRVPPSLRDELRDEVPSPVRPALLWIADIVESHARPPIGRVEVWAQPSAAGVDWHVDKDEELYHRNRIVRTADRSFVAYLDPRSTRGLMVCADDNACEQTDRVSPRLGRLVAFDPGRAHAAENPSVVWDPRERALDPASTVFHNGPGPLHVAEDYPSAPPPSSPEFRCLVFNVWSRHEPEHVANASSRGLQLRSATGGWTATGPFSDGIEAVRAAQLGSRLRRRARRRLRPCLL